MIPTQMRRPAQMASTLVCLMLVAACGSSGDDGSAGDASSSSASSAADISSDVPSLDELYKGNFTAPPTDGPKAATGKTVWFISCGEQVSGCSAVSGAAKKAAEAIGWDFHIADGNLGIADGYTAATRTAIAANPDAIIVHGWSCEDAQQALQEANDAGIKVIGVDNTDCSDLADPGPELFNVPMIYSEEMPDNPSFWQKYGQMAAAYAIRATDGQAKLIYTKQTDGLALQVDEGFTSELEKCPGCEISETITASDEDTVPNGGWIQGMRAALVRHPDANAAFMEWDFMMSSLGGAQAVKESGLDLTTFGGLGTQDGLDLVRSGDVAAITGGRDVGWVAWAAMDQLNRAFNNEPSVPQGIGFLVIDKDHNLPAAGTDFISPVDYQSAYREVWGK